ncbi:hypothetical protein BH11PSE12_BH11PSE12_33050 [soil metagenome]
MVESLNCFRKKLAVKGSCVLLMCALAPLAMAEILSDPTRPPASFGIAKATDAQMAASGPTLQSVLISSGRKVAVISGQVVNLGGKFGDAQVVKITESEVVLLTGNNLQTLKLFPNVEKRLTSSGGRSQADIRRQ